MRTEFQDLWEQSKCKIENSTSPGLDLKPNQPRGLVVVSLIHY